jgi:DNA-binding winged helix-turn-helix (wHTH) protein/TolB-like protein
VRFGEFTVDLSSGELFRNGERVRIQALPLRVLGVLLESAGQLVTREQLRSRLWGSETFVDAEAGLNTAIAKLREALGDDAEAPRFIETLPKRGYRFRGPVEAAPRPPIRPTHSEEPISSPELAASPTSRWWRRRPTQRAMAVGVLVLVGLASALAWRTSADRTTTIAVLLFHNETGDPQYDQLAQQLTDGTVVALAANRQLDVIGNAAILRTPRIFADIQRVGNALHAEFVVLGQLQRGGDGLVVRTHFIRVSDQKHLWAHPTTGDATALDRQVPLDVAQGVRDAFDQAR